MVRKADQYFNSLQESGRFYETLWKDIYPFVIRLAGNPNDAEELTQESLIRIWQKLHLYDRKKEFLPWVRTIIINIHRGRLRKLYRREETSIDNPVNQEEDESYTFADILEDRSYETKNEEKDKGGLINVVMGIIKEKCEQGNLAYQVMWHKDIRDMPYKCAAEIIGIPMGTVKSRRSRALIDIRKRVSKLQKELAA